MRTETETQITDEHVIFTVRTIMSHAEYQRQLKQFKPKPAPKKLPVTHEDKMQDLEKRKIDFLGRVNYYAQLDFSRTPCKYPQGMFTEFYNWWSEITDGEYLMKWEKRAKEGSFQISRRLVTWFNTLKEKRPDILNKLWDEHNEKYNNKIL